MRIIDSQVHIWAASTRERPWPARHQPHRSEPLGADELLAAMDGAGVDVALLVPPSWEGEYNDLVTAAVRAHPGRLAALGVVDPADAPSWIERWEPDAGLLGLRFALHRPGLVEALTDGRMDRVWRSAEERGVPLMVLLPHALLPNVAAAARRHPALKVTIDHLGLVGTSPQDRPASWRAVLELSELANVALKATCLPSFATTDTYPFRQVHPMLRQAISAFGAARVFWGTDMTRLPCSYRQAVTMVTEEMPWLSSRDRELFMGRGLSQWISMYDPEPSTCVAADVLPT